MSTPELQAATAMDLMRVATAADAVEWLNHRAAQYLVDAGGQPSEDDARGMRLAASTLEVVAEVSRWWRDDVAAADGISKLARSYPASAATKLPSETRYYRVACAHVGDALGQLAARLNHAVAPERARRASAEVTAHPVGPGRDL